jgi:hypothetical protein
MPEGGAVKAVDRKRAATAGPGPEGGAVKAVDRKQAAAASSSPAGQGRPAGGKVSPLPSENGYIGLW